MLGSVRHVACAVCAADDYRVLFPKSRQVHQIVKCNRCGLMYANPQEVVDCEEFVLHNATRKIDPEGADRQYCQKQHVQMPDSERALQVLNDFCPKRGRLLEIGSYLGLLLERCRAAGWDTTGLEPFRPAANYARSKYGLQIIEGVLPNPALKDQSFDAVLMLHVIEHMPDPTENVREIRRILRKGGMLVVETPRFDSLMFKLFGKRERSINNCPGHIYFFTVPLLRRLLEDNGFEILRVDLVGRTLTMERLFYNVGVMSRNTRILNGIQRLARAFHLDQVHLHVNVRDMQRIYCRAR